jgi:hypothetical protein
MVKDANESLALDLKTGVAFFDLNFKKGLKNPVKVNHFGEIGLFQIPKDLKLSYLGFY